MPGADARCDADVSVPEHYGEQPTWKADVPRISVLRFLLGWIVAAVAVEVSIWIAPGSSLEQTGAAFLVAALIACSTRCCRRSWRRCASRSCSCSGFLLVLAADAAVLLLADRGASPTTSTSAASATRCSRRC